jgi:hypothetical protein
MHFGRILFFVTCAAVGAAVAWISQPYVHENSDATTVVVTVMTVLAGFMIAIITVLGDPASVPDGTWRTVEARRENIKSKIIRHAYYSFCIYWLWDFYLPLQYLKKFLRKISGMVGING